MNVVGTSLGITPRKVTKNKISLLQERRQKVNAVGGKRIYGSDVVFIIKPCKSVQWGENMNINSSGAKWYTYDSLIVVTNLETAKLAWFGRLNEKIIHDNIVNEVRTGKVRSLVELYSLISTYCNRYGAPVKLIETKLERHYD